MYACTQCPRRNSKKSLKARCLKTDRHSIARECYQRWCHWYQEGGTSEWRTLQSVEPRTWMWRHTLHILRETRGCKRGGIISSSGSLNWTDWSLLEEALTCPNKYRDPYLRELTHSKAPSPPSIGFLTYSVTKILEEPWGVYIQVLNYKIKVKK